MEHCYQRQPNSLEPNLKGMTLILSSYFQGDDVTTIIGMDSKHVELPVFEEYQHIVELALQYLFYTSLDELKQILSKGVHLNGYKTWFSLNEKGEHCHMISMKDCLIPNQDSTPEYYSYKKFPAGFYLTKNRGFKTHAKTQFLSPSIIYTMNLVCDFSVNREQGYGKLKYRLRGETTTSTVNLANLRRFDDWLYRVELFQFTSDGSITEVEITFDNHKSDLQVEGILFQPLEKLENRTMKKKIYSTLGKCFRFNNQEDDKVEEKYAISDSGLIMIKMRRNMLSVRWGCLTVKGNFIWPSLPESRFGEVLVISAGDKFERVNEIKPEVLSADTTYASYFVCKLPQDQSTCEDPLEVNTKYGFRVHICGLSIC
ncbi:protein kinase domain, Nitrogen network kinase 1, Phloem protein 2-like protein [Artemisia annua]|uniref:Protein kinase domain, Nitrogen network kinase 1, Phloem protein 2-like protein n=1 Tax=Artemisia annua TaxID=35608 RepID=A0A2U1MWA2_ARTAN|nr:protein kinase domain, Nitrogen network kinase 1, Phloem protein 2-like protein [Artemisia annua]